MALSTFRVPLAASLRRMLTMRVAALKVSSLTYITGKGTPSADSMASMMLSTPGERQPLPPDIRTPETGGKPRDWMAVMIPRRTSPRSAWTTTKHPGPLDRIFSRRPSMWREATSMARMGTRSSALCPNRTLAPREAAISAGLISAITFDSGSRPMGGKWCFASDLASSTRSVSTGSLLKMTPFTLLEFSTAVSNFMTSSFTSEGLVASETLPTKTRGRPRASAILRCQVMPTAWCPMTTMKSKPRAARRWYFSMIMSNRSESRSPSSMRSSA
mmetsp:Transcript_39462/g.111818  ORF Transcript_39462/g.111818 Transcript_39462/m.111818 type:complete len:273 (+) Transcript_39462:932-1750(+)